MKGANINAEQKGTGVTALMLAAEQVSHLHKQGLHSLYEHIEHYCNLDEKLLKKLKFPIA